MVQGFWSLMLITHYKQSHDYSIGTMDFHVLCVIGILNCEMPHFQYLSLSVANPVMYTLFSSKTDKSLAVHRARMESNFRMELPASSSWRGVHAIVCEQL